MLDEHPDVRSPEEYGAYVPEIDCDDPGGLGAQERPPARRSRHFVSGRETHPVGSASPKPTLPG